MYFWWGEFRITNFKTVVIELLYFNTNMIYLYAFEIIMVNFDKVSR